MTDEAVLLLAVAGLSESDERLYLFVVHRGRTRPDDVAARFDLPVGEALNRLEMLRDLGLVTTWQGSADVYAAVDPRYALGAVADRVSDQVRRIRDQIPVLSDHFERALAEEAGTARTRVVTDTGEVAGWFVRLQHQAKSELVIFDRPPYVSNPQEPLESIVIGRGVSWRAVYSAASFTREGAWEETARLADQGEQGRIVSSLPLKLVIADRSIALVSLDLDGVNNHALVTESPALVELLLDVFEGHWGRGIPLTATTGGRREDLAAQLAAADPPESRPSSEVRRSGPPPTREQQSILALIGSGLTDEAIAARLGLSVRSLRRRSQQLMTDLGAENRFQLGAEAARRGWV